MLLENIFFIVVCTGLTALGRRQIDLNRAKTFLKDDKVKVLPVDLLPNVSLLHVSPVFEDP